MAPVRPTTGIYAAAVLVIAASVVVLFQLQRRFETDLESRITTLQRVFADPAILKNPRDRFVDFAEIEALAGKYHGISNFQGLTLTKFFGSEERVVYPFYLEAIRHVPVGEAIRPTEYPLPWDLKPGIRKLPLSYRDEILGNLYLRVDRSSLTNVRVVMASLTLLLAGAVSLLLFQFRKQEKVISQTTVELEQKHRELVRLERLALAGQLSANVFHDLKKPVLNIKNEMEELESTESAGSGTLAKVARQIRDQVELFFGILREGNLERFVRAQPDREFVDINEMIERSLALVRYERAAVVVRLSLAENLPPFLAEPVRLIQVFSNLILNAYQAMDGHGELAITTSIGDEQIRVRFSDTGPGIAPDVLDRIFLPFFTTKSEEKGTGLGLYITRDIIRDYGGEIAPEISPQGMTFTVILPVRPE